MFYSNKLLAKCSKTRKLQNIIVEINFFFQNYKTCFPSGIFPFGLPCWTDRQCASGVCTGGSQSGYTVVKGTCAAGQGKHIFDIIPPVPGFSCVMSWYKVSRFTKLFNLKIMVQ